LAADDPQGTPSDTAGQGPNRSKAVHSRRTDLRAAADARAKALAPVIREIRRAGYTTLRDMSEELNRLEVPTVHGRRWHPMTVARLLARLG
jgi:hypothetical protein